MSEDKQLDELSKELFGPKETLKRAASKAKQAAEKAIDMYAEERDNLMKAVDKSGLLDTTAEGWREAGEEFAKGVKREIVKPIVGAVKEVTGITQKERQTQEMAEAQKRADERRKAEEAARRTARAKEIGVITEEYFPLPVEGEDQWRQIRTWVSRQAILGEWDNHKVKLYCELGKLTDGDVVIIREFAEGSSRRELTEFSQYAAETKRREDDYEHWRRSAASEKKPVGNESLNADWYLIAAASHQVALEKAGEAWKQLRGRIETEEQYATEQALALKVIQEAWHEKGENPMKDASREIREALRKNFFAVRGRLVVTDKNGERKSGQFFRHVCRKIANTEGEASQGLIIDEFVSVAQASWLEGMENKDELMINRFDENLARKGVSEKHEAVTLA